MVIDSGKAYFTKDDLRRLIAIMTKRHHRQGIPKPTRDIERDTVWQLIAQNPYSDHIYFYPNEIDYRSFCKQERAAGRLPKVTYAG